MLSKAERHAFGILENVLLFSIVYKYSKNYLRSLRKRSQVTGVTMCPLGPKTVTGHRCDHVTFGHKGGENPKNAECKQEDNLLYHLS